MEFEVHSVAILDTLILKLVKEPTLPITYGQAKIFIESKTSVEEIDAFIVSMAQQGVGLDYSKIAILTYFTIKWDAIVIAVQQALQQN